MKDEPKLKEYLRRNLLVCKAYGALASAQVAREREMKSKRPRQWLIKQLDMIIERVEGLPSDLATYRDQASAVL